MSASYHIQSVNPLHSRFKDFHRPFRGPVSKKLAGYIQWFHARARSINPSDAMQRALR